MIAPCRQDQARQRHREQQRHGDRHARKRAVAGHVLAREFPQLRERRDGALTLKAISSGGLAANTAWAREHDLGEILVQDGHEVASRYRLRGTPTAVLIDTRGRIAAPPAGGIREIRDLLTSPAPTPART